MKYLLLCCNEEKKLNAMSKSEWDALVGKTLAYLEELRKSFAIAPTAPAHVLEGQILAGQGNCADALRAFDEALKIEPGNAVAQEARKSCGK